MPNNRRDFLRILSAIAGAGPGLAEGDDAMPDRISEAARALGDRPPEDAAKDEGFWAVVRDASATPARPVNLMTGWYGALTTAVQRAVIDFWDKTNAPDHHGLRLLWGLVPQVRRRTARHRLSVRQERTYSDTLAVLRVGELDDPGSSPRSTGGTMMHSAMKTLGFLAFAIALAATTASADSITIGAPGDPNTGNSFPFTFDKISRYQQVYSANLFPGAVIINEIDFFDTIFVPPSASAGVYNTANYTFSLSSTSKAVNGLDTSNLNNNPGPNALTFFVGTRSGPTGSTLSFVGTPFLYNPATGNLLLDVIKTNVVAGTGSGFLDAHNGTFGNLSSRALDQVGASSQWGLVTGFGFQAVPEPTSLILMGIGMAATLGCFWSRRRRVG